MMTGGVLAAVGVILFYGLIIPHVLRRFFGSDHTNLVPLCACYGSVILLIMDLALRMLDIRAFALGNITAVFGGLALMILLLKYREQAAYHA
jgi:iron complex transport system permease protein